MDGRTFLMRSAVVGAAVMIRLLQCGHYAAVVMRVVRSAYRIPGGMTGWVPVLQTIDSF